MNYKIIISNEAHEDFSEINKYISWYLKNEKAANKLINKILVGIKQLEVFPKRHQLCDEPLLLKKGIRYLLTNNFKTLFYVDDEKNIVYILRIIYAKRDINSVIFSI